MKLQIKKFKEENTALQDRLKVEESEEAHTREAYRSLKDYARKLKRFSHAHVKKLQMCFRNQGCQIEKEDDPPLPLPTLGLDSLSDIKEISLVDLDGLLKGVFGLRNHSIQNKVVHHGSISQIWWDDPIPHIIIN
jgi:hypothetical protein